MPQLRKPKPKLAVAPSIQIGPQHSPYETAVARAELTKQLKKLPNNFVACRDLQHAWDRADGFTLEEMRGGKQRIVRQMECMRCGTVRLDYFRILDGGLVKTRSDYSYPDGFLIPKSPPGTKPLAIVRAESLRRALGVDISVA